jgi:hypothetical protein
MKAKLQCPERFASALSRHAPQRLLPEARLPSCPSSPEGIAAYYVTMQSRMESQLSANLTIAVAAVNGRRFYWNSARFVCKLQSRMDNLQGYAL